MEVILMSLVAFWFGTLVVMALIVKKTEKPNTPMSIAIHERKNIYK